ncbi:MAG: hypothetical protein NT013_24680 [Planctomycetia bacterium]|nr:hypothetical protein [Planctomycetia bacterium]
MSNQVSDVPRRLAIPRSRRLVIDLMRLHQQTPTTAHDRICDLTAVAAARANANVRIAWPMLFIKAYGLVAQRYPQLRQIFMRWPWPHLYQHPTSVATVVTFREVDNESWLFWSRFLHPERQSLTSLQDKMDEYQVGPVEKVFRKQWFFSSLPSPLRRLIWWWTLNVSGEKRARRTSTFVLTTVGSRGAEIQHPPGFLTGNLTYGPIDDHGRCRITLAYDHRLLDGRMVADILADLEVTLNEVIAAELSGLSSGKRNVIPLARFTTDSSMNSDTPESESA